MTEKEYLSVKEFSEKTRLTQQAIYLRIKQDLEPYIKIIDGKKKISTEALKLFETNKVDENTNNFLEKALSILEQQLRVKDEQLEKSNKRLAEALELNKNNQILLKQAQMEKQALLDNDSQSEKQVVEQELENDEEKNEKKGMFDGIRKFFKG